MIATMRERARYVKIVEWLDTDQCYVGSCPGLFYGGCHGDNEQAVFKELCQIVEETISLYKTEGRPLPPPPAAKTTKTKCRRSRVGRSSRPIPIGDCSRKRKTVFPCPRKREVHHLFIDLEVEK